MIRFGLICDKDHEFEAWFRNSDDFEAQKKRDLVVCPQCDSHAVRKALMTPAVSVSKKKAPVALGMNEEQKKALAQIRMLADKIRDNAEYVGDKFANEARKIHFGEAEARGIYGEATPEEAKGLIEDGVEFMPLPVLPDERN